MKIQHNKESLRLSSAMRFLRATEQLQHHARAARIKGLLTGVGLAGALIAALFVAHLLL